MKSEAREKLRALILTVRGFYIGKCKELPNAFTQAKTLGQLRKRMAEVIDLILEDIEEEHAKNPKRIIEVVA